MSALWRTIKKNWKNIILLCLAFAMGLTGVILVVKTTSESEDTLYSMHEVHLRNLLNSIDHNTKIVVDQCYSALTLFVTRPDVCAAESALLDGDSTPLSALIAQTDLIEVMNGVLVTNAAGDVLVAVGDVSTETYTFCRQIRKSTPG